MGYVRICPRLWPDKQDEEQRAEFVKKLDELKGNPEVEIWFQDECGVMGDPKPRRVIAKKGTRLSIGYTGKHFKDNVVGAVRPSDGKFFSLIMPYVNTQIFQLFIDEMQKHIGSKKVVLILDNASWHKTRSLNWGRITPVFLSPYSPDFNPIERIWLVLKNSFFSTFFAKTHDELTERLEVALRYFIHNPEVCKSICGG